MLTAERLRELLHYNKDTGEFTRLVTVNNYKAKAGDKAACRSRGYGVLRVDGVLYRASRLAWLWMTGRWPDPECDHKDTNPSNNAWPNLREATSRQNKGNMKTPSHNTSGLKGVSWRPDKRKYRATIQVNGITMHLGTFDCPAAAHCAYIIAATKTFGEFARSA